MNATILRFVACLAVVIATTTVRAQTKGAEKVPSSAPGSITTAAPPAATPQVPTDSTTPRAGILSERVVFSDGRPVVGASVSVTSVDQKVTIRRIDTTGATGIYRVDAIPRGEYEVAITFPWGISLTRRLQVDTTSAPNDLIVSALPLEERRSMREVLWTVAAILLYLLAIGAARWHNIARSVNEILHHQLTTLQMRLYTEVGNTPSALLDQVRTNLQGLIDEQRQAQKGWPSFSELLFWSRGRENAVWFQIHEIERQLAAFLSPPEQVEVYLRWVQPELRNLNTTSAQALADAVAESLKLAPPADDTQRLAFESARKALLGRALWVLFFARDGEFSSLMEWQNKAGWLILAALIFIIFLTAAAGNAVLFLAGAAGGFLSRLARALKRDDVPLDYGASWTTLFLSPVLGALIAWFGVALISLLVDGRVNLLGSAFKLVDWSHPRSPWTLGIAFVLGFSERLFDSLVAVLENHAVEDTPTGSAATRPGASPSKPADTSTAQTTAVAGTPTTPTISGAELKIRANGASQDSLVISGTGFVPNCKVKVNGQVRTARVDSLQQITLPLSDSDLQRISVGGDFDIVVTTPDGASSAPFAFAGVLTP